MSSVDGEYNDWSDWGQCNVSCGGGITVRNRTCSQPQFDGLDCEGLSEEGQECSTNPCPGEIVFVLSCRHHFRCFPCPSVTRLCHPCPGRSFSLKNIARQRCFRLRPNHAVRSFFCVLCEFWRYCFNFIVVHLPRER